MTAPSALAARWLRTLAEIAIRAVGPKQVVKTILETLDRAEFRLRPSQYYVVALGKAAGPQLQEWLASAPPPREHRALAPRGYGAPPQVHMLLGSHPLPGPESFRAGRALREWLTGLQPDWPLVVLASGGGSAAIEDPAPGYTSEEIARVSRELVGCGAPIAAINGVRAQWSTLKAGGALALAGSRPVVLAIQADVPPGQECWVSSGPFEPGPFEVAARAQSLFQEYFPGRTWREPGGAAPFRGLRILAGSNQLCLQTAQHVARREGLSVQTFPEALCGDAREIGARVAELARGSAADVLLLGGEPTVQLSANPGQGGRLGLLALSYGLSGWTTPPYPLLACASDGVDGASRGAGAFWLPGPFDAAAARSACDDQDSDRFFQRMRWLLKLPTTGANVRDLVFVLRTPEKLKNRDA